jgi:hypothetical protein
MKRNDASPGWIPRAASLLVLLAGCSDDGGPTLPARTDETPPAAITDLSIIATSANSLTLAWTASGDDRAEGVASHYDIRYSAIAFDLGSWDSLPRIEPDRRPKPAGAAETLRVDGLVLYMTYSFGLRVGDAASNWSAVSDIVSARTTMLSNPAPPNRIADLAARPVSPTSLFMTWTSPGNDDTIGTAVSYDVRISRAPIGDWSAATRILGPKPRRAGELDSLVIASLKEGATYYLGIRALDTGGLWSRPSNIATTSTIPDTIPPHRITDLVATVRSPTSAVLTWTAPGDDDLEGPALEYDIRLSGRAEPQSGWSEAARIDTALAPGQAGELETLLIDGLEIDSTYAFAIRAADNRANWSGWSNTATVGPLVDDVPPRAIVDLFGVPEGGRVVRLQWSAPGDDGCEGRATGYDMRFSSSPLVEATWEAATPVPTMLVPQGCGSPETFAFELPDDTTLYHIAVRAVDDGGRSSPLSNVVSIRIGLAEEDAHWIRSLPLDIDRYARITCVEATDDFVMIAGAFTMIGLRDVNSVAWGDGFSWWPMGTGFPPRETVLGPGIILSSTTYEGGVVVGGYITESGPHGSYVGDRIHAAWNGSSWRSLGAPGSDFGISSAVSAVFGAGAWLYYAGGWGEGEWEYPEYYNYVERLSGETRERIGMPDGGVGAITQHGGLVIIGGAFTSVDGVAAKNVAMWDGASWNPMGAGLDGNVRALLSDGAKLVAGGDFRTSGGTVVNHIAEWDGGAWRPLADGLSPAGDAFVTSIAFYNGDIVAGGRIPEWETRGIRNIARWDGAEWRRLGSGVDADVHDLAEFQGTLFVVGAFDSAGGNPSPMLAQWRD